MPSARADRACAEARRADRRAPAAPPHAAGRRALCGEEPVRRRRPAHAGRLEDRARRRAGRGAMRVLVRRLEAAGAVLVGALHMDEYAYGFSTENTHYGPTRNPHDLTRISGGSCGGSAAAVAAGQVPLSAGLRHQRLDPRAGRRCAACSASSPPSAGCRARAATPSSPASTTWAPSRAACTTWRWPTTRCKARCTAAQRRPGLRAARRRADAAAAGPGRAGPAHRRARRLVPRDGAARGHRRGRCGGPGAGHHAAGGAARSRARARRGLPDHLRRRRRAAPGRPAEARRTTSTR